MCKLLFYITLIIYNLAYPLFSYSQKPDSIKMSKSGLGVTFSADQCFRTLKSNEDELVALQQRNKEEIPRVGYTTGLNFYRRLSKRMSFAVGARYSSKGFKTKQIDLHWATPDGDLPKKWYTVHRYHYIELPMNLDYNFQVHKKLNLFISAGVSVDKFIGKNTQLIITDHGRKERQSSIRKTMGYSSWNLAIVMGFGLNYEISNRLKLRFESIGKYSLTPVSPKLPLKENLYSVGLQVGVFYLW